MHSAWLAVSLPAGSAWYIHNNTTIVVITAHESLPEL